MRFLPLLLGPGQVGSVQPRHQNELVLRGGARQDLQPGKNVINLARREPAKFRALHREASRRQDAALLRNRNRGVLAVAGDHSHGDAAGLAGRHGCRHVWPEGVQDAEDRVHAQGLLELFRRAPDRAGARYRGLPCPKVPVRNDDHPERTILEGRDRPPNLFSHACRERRGLPGGVREALRKAEHNLRCTLHVEPRATGINRYQGGHSLPRRGEREHLVHARFDGSPNL
mmetsp:Transcript_1375/g.5910  ORF Transcript_1375/g.5910 Transcript_1375/m.5910 type:complete len:229 (+) Transcript_1375:597-1283(+)